MNYVQSNEGDGSWELSILDNNWLCYQRFLIFTKLSPQMLRFLKFLSWLFHLLLRYFRGYW